MASSTFSKNGMHHTSSSSSLNPCSIIWLFFRNISLFALWILLMSFSCRCFLTSFQNYSWNEIVFEVGWKQWRRYTRARQVKWPGWKIHCSGSNTGSAASALPSHAYCFALVLVWTENNNVTISDLFICFILMVKRCFESDNYKKGCQLFEEKNASGWPGWRIFWPRNDLAPLLCWHCHCWKWTRLDHQTLACWAAPCRSVGPCRPLIGKL